MRPHIGGAECTVETDAHGVAVFDRDGKRLGGLAREGAAGAIGDGARNEDRHFRVAPHKEQVKGKEAGLRVQGVEDGLDQQDVGATIEQGLGLLGVRFDKLIEGTVPELGLLNRRRNRQGPVGRADRASDQALPAVELLLVIASHPGEDGGGFVERVDLL